MRPQSLIWFAIIFVVAFAMLGASQCSYNKLRSMHTLENQVAEIGRKHPKIEHISTSTLATLIEADQKGAVPLLLIDNRSPKEFAVSHIPGAVNLESVEAIKAHLGKSDAKPSTIAVYCSIGARSSDLVEKLQKAGISNAKNVRGSIFQWANEDRDLITSDGGKAEKVHPFNDMWGRLLNENRRADLGEKTNE